MSSTSHCVKRFHPNKSNFSIDHILNGAGEKQSLENLQSSKEIATANNKFDWLNCTRYRPPKLQRQRKKEGITRRKLGRNPRIPFSSSQVAFLEAKFLRTPYLSSNDVSQLANYLKLSETRVKIWFQNRRARERREKDTKFNSEVNSVKNAVKLKPPQRPSPTLPFSFSDRNAFFRHALGSESANRFPLDLRERPTAYGSNDF